LKSAIGLPQRVTRNRADYQNLAIDLARHGEKRRRLREQLVRNRKSMPLFNTSLFARHLETAYLQMWQHFLDGQKPRPFSVEDLSGVDIGPSPLPAVTDR
jgi:predicted O-linked N-acetylglucosamine transferase (SPINDLY family)